MPSIVLTDESGELFIFGTSDYFVYPTHQSSTQAIMSSLGIKIFENTNNTVSFGRLFVQKFGLRL